MYKHASKLITILLLVSILASCGAQSGTTDTTDVSGDTTAPETTIDMSEIDELPEKNFGGYEFRILSRTPGWCYGAWLVEEETGEVLNDAMYNRNAAIAERFNITFTEKTTTKSDEARTSLMAGDNAYDVINTRCANAWTWAEEGLLVSTDDLPYINLNKAYWDDSLNACLSIGGVNYFAIGATNLSSYDYTHVLLFNKKMLEDNQLESPYALVKSGKWTMDAFQKLTSDVTNDINGDAVMDDKDAYGIISQPKHILPGMWIGADILTITKDENDIPTFNLASDTKFIDVFEKSYAMTWDNDAWYANKLRANNDLTLTTIFQEGRGLFMDYTFYYISTLRDMDADFGIIPYPKYDEKQENYFSRIEGAEFTAIPVTSPDLERTSVILEALACESYQSVVPAYYDIALKTKYTRDDESAQMLDIIFNNRIFDLGDTIWCDTLRDGVFETMFMNNDRNLSSQLAAVDSKIKEAIKKTVDNLT